jgi:small subunit ribosomal protein S1
VTCSVTAVTDAGIEVTIGEEGASAFIRRNDLSRDRNDQNSSRFSVGDKVDAQVIGKDKATRRLNLSIKAMEISEEKEAVAQYGSSDSGASLGDILGAALKAKSDTDKKPVKKAPTKAKAKVPKEDVSSKATTAKEKKPVKKAPTKAKAKVPKEDVSSKTTTAKEKKPIKKEIAQKSKPKKTAAKKGDK